MRAMKQKILKMSEKLNAEGLRVLLVAIREFEGNHPLNYSVADENNLTLTGFIGFLILQNLPQNQVLKLCISWV